MTWLARELVRLHECPSTSDEAMRRARDGAPHGLTVIADTQTRGRGRQGHVWFSPPGENLYFSMVLRLARPPAEVPPVTLAAGVAVCDAVNALGVPASLKWPNDILVGGKKLSGILTEMSTHGARAEAIVVGIGVNVNTLDFPPELAATSLRRELASSAPLDRDAVFARLVAELERWFDAFAAGPTSAIAAAWRARTHMIGTPVRVAAEGGAEVRGIAADLDEQGALLVDTPDGRRVRVIAGEILEAA